MTPSRFIPVCLLLVAAITHPTWLSAQNPTQLAGAWTLNRQLSQFPTDIGFSADFFGGLAPRPGRGPVLLAGAAGGAAAVEAAEGIAAASARRASCARRKKTRSASRHSPTKCGIPLTT